ncbi:MAG TPA: DEAD/DEAH box helicase [Porphyromonadaceae bacterium]|nr:DEAD/DEAH box helicase [Porphyromonadaceae bacterium]HBN64817.1 DEAD/DEAH box helicase [Porphyromonadaceae bacterium]
MDTTEKGLEYIIVDYLRDVNGYNQGGSPEYNKTYALLPDRVEAFIRKTQLEKADELRVFDTPSERNKFFTRLRDEITRRGVTDVLRKGFRYITLHFDLYYVLPSELNPTAKRLYEDNDFTVIRQLHYSPTDTMLSIDLALFINGLPVITMELKNRFTGQTVENAKAQYQNNRDPKDLLFKPKRCAVHLAVDDTDIAMCSMLAGKSSWFLPFNKGNNGGKGNPVNPNGLKTAYLWEEVLTKQSLSNILEDFAQVVEEKDEKTGKTKTKVIWPRYHQLEVVRRLLKETKEKGVGHRYLIQHSAGSGKSNSITWLAYQLVGLLKNNEPVVDSVIVVTDRVNLDKQIRDNIRSFQKLSNVVAWADSSETLASALKGGKQIIITIVHKFPYILDAIGSTLKNNRFAIIIDEAHSSQNGSMSAKMNIGVSGNASDEDEDLEDKIAKIVAGRKMAANANYYAFTATPKNKTLEMFGTPMAADAEGNVPHVPFHVYSMKQAIEEGFIMDVLQNYTPYQSYYKVVRAIEEDPEFDKKQASAKIRAWVEAQPETIDAKARIIVEHFHENVINKGKVGGQARAMVVTSSIIRAIEMYYAISEKLRQRNSPFKAIVAFSGDKEYNGKQVNEAAVNGFPSSEIETRMGQDPYRILIVADKFQTGYDQPLLHTMYVDKVLSDVKAVQTLSRLNRCHPKKRDTFVLDFAGNAELIAEAFQKYYKATNLNRETDPNKLNDLLAKIEEYSIFTMDEVEEINRIFLSEQDRTMLDPILDTAVERFKGLDDDGKIDCKSAIKGYNRIYPFLAAVIPHSSKYWEKMYIYLHLLAAKLPRIPREDWTEGLLDAIDFDQYRSIKQTEAQFQMENEDAGIDPVPVGGGGSTSEPDFDKLSNILEEFNATFGGIEWQHPEAAIEQIRQLPERLAANENFSNAVRRSDEQMAEIESNNALFKIVVEILSEKTEFARNYLDNPQFQAFVNQRVFNQAYNQVAK